MTQQEIARIANALDDVATYATLLKEKAEGLRRRLARFHEPASRKRAVIPDAEIAKILMQRRKNKLKSKI